MFFLGQLAGSATPLAYFNDVIGLVTGAITSTDQLTAFIKESVKMVRTVEPGWSIHDPAPGAANSGIIPKVIKAPWSDDPTKFKYVRYESDATSWFRWMAFETWNATTHVGTNPFGHGPSTGVEYRRHALPVNGWVMISASANHLLVAVMTSVLYNASIHYQFFSEYTRDDPWNKVENGYPAWFQAGCVQGNYNGYMNTNLGLGRLPNLTTLPFTDAVTIPAGSNDSGNSRLFRILPALVRQHTGGIGSNTQANTTAGLEGAGSFLAGQDGYTADANKQVCLPLSPLTLRAGEAASYGAHFGGSITEKAPIYITRPQFVTGDEIEVGGDRYFMLTLNVSCIAIKEA